MIEPDDDKIAEVQIDQAWIDQCWEDARKVVESERATIAARRNRKRKQRFRARWKWRR